MVREYWRGVSDRALKEAAQVLRLESRVSVVMAGLVLVCVVLFLTFWGSADASRDELVARAGIAVAFVGAFPLVYLWKLASIPPQLDMERRKKIDQLIAKLSRKADEVREFHRSRVSAAESFELWEVACLLSGADFQRPVPNGAAFMELELLRRAFEEGRLTLKNQDDLKQKLWLSKSMGRLDLSGSAKQKFELNDREAVRRDDLVKYLGNQGRKIDGLNA